MQKIREALKSANLSEVQRETGISRVTLYRIMRGGETDSSRIINTLGAWYDRVAKKP